MGRSCVPRITGLTPLWKAIKTELATHCSSFLRGTKDKTGSRTGLWKGRTDRHHLDPHSHQRCNYTSWIGSPRTRRGRQERLTRGTQPRGYFDREQSTGTSHQPPALQAASICMREHGIPFIHGLRSPCFDPDMSLRVTNSVQRAKTLVWARRMMRTAGLNKVRDNGGLLCPGCFF